jgi:cytochrome c oxidase subunit I+III
MSAAPRRFWTDRRPMPRCSQALRATWSDPPGWLGSLRAIDHKTIARRFIVATFVFFFWAASLRWRCGCSSRAPGCGW